MRKKGMKGLHIWQIQLQNREGVLTTIHDIQKQSKKYMLPKILK